MSSKTLWFACESGDKAEVIRLLARGVKANYMNGAYLDYTPLMVAADRGHDPVVQVLLQRGAVAITSNHRGETALHIACYNGKADCVRLLIEHGADVNKQDEYGETPLHRACSTCKPGLVQQLLEAGARTDVRDSYGKLPVDDVPKDKTQTQQIRKMLVEAATAGTGTS